MWGALALALVGCSPRAPRAVAQREATAPNPAEVAADSLRALLAADDADRCAAEGEAQVRQHPGSGRLRAWWLACVARTGRNGEAAAQVDRWLAERPDDAWARWARLAVWLEESEPARPASLADTAALVEAMAGHPDAVRLRAAALARWHHGDELAALVAVHPDAPPWARAVARLEKARGDATLVPQALADAHEIAATDPEFVTAAALVGAGLERAMKLVEALAWVDRGLQRAPDSLQLRARRWWLLQLQPAEPAANKRAVLEDIAATLARAGARPAVLLAAARTYRQLGEPGLAEPLEARLLREFADSPAAEALVAARDRALTGDDPYSTAKPSPAQLAAQGAADAAFLARPRHHDPLLREAAALRRFEAAVADPAAPPAAVVAAVEAARPLLHREQLRFFSAAARALIDRGGEPARAEALVREGLAAVADEVEVARARGHSFDGYQGWIEGELYDLLARVRLSERRVADAEAALAAATKRGSQGDDHTLAQAELVRLRGDAAEADRLLVACSDAQDGDVGDDACRRALAAAWLRTHGSQRGLDAHAAKLLARVRAERRQQVFAAIAAEPRPAPEFRFTTLDGQAVSSESARGKLTVLHFWFTACGPCVEELPRWQQFVDAHARPARPRAADGPRDRRRRRGHGVAARAPAALPGGDERRLLRARPAVGLPDHVVPRSPGPDRLRGAGRRARPAARVRLAGRGAARGRGQARGVRSVVSLGACLLRQMRRPGRAGGRRAAASAPHGMSFATGPGRDGPSPRSARPRGAAGCEGICAAVRSFATVAARCFAPRPGSGGARPRRQAWVDI
ncbi:AhpC/TSA family protein [Nannocystis exedens]|uniref:AhpC/TSA family protein n=1 Tax=Nannocystis exedens TaxID=54 RepID=A0A1I2AW39_9BACT|nr:TlpA disulfide reductase family protein [Nannocystis exedens]PCC74258.1 Sporulation thiol-disulfide oxidoreductase A precursor [Nannocystis exedens]SFE47100.1 AhpC/TSA family protein [Nannocystis exedens]